MTEYRNFSGLVFKVTAAELRTHLLVRVEYHTSRANHLEKHLLKLREAAKTLHTTEDAVNQAQVEARDHQRKADRLQWMSLHLFEQDYLLSVQDAEAVEFIRRAADW